MSDNTFHYSLFTPGTTFIAHPFIHDIIGEATKVVNNGVRSYVVYFKPIGGETPSYIDEDGLGFINIFHVTKILERKPGIATLSSEPLDTHHFAHPAWVGGKLKHPNNYRTFSPHHLIVTILEKFNKHEFVDIVELVGDAIESGVLRREYYGESALYTANKKKLNRWVRQRHCSRIIPVKQALEEEAKSRQEMYDDMEDEMDDWPW